MTCEVCDGRGEVGGFDHAEMGYRTEPCQCCGGDGGHFEDGGSTRWTRCSACNGDGELEVETAPLNVDDLEFGPIYTTLGEK